MIIVYTPEDGPEQTFNMREVLASEAKIVERTTDMRWGQIKVQAREDDPTALRGVIWILMKRADPTLRWSDFDPRADDMCSRFDAREVAAYASEIVALPKDKQANPIAELKAYAFQPEAVDAALEDARQSPKALAVTEPTSASTSSD